MMKRRNRFRAGLIWATALLLLLLGSSAQAVTRDMVGSWGVINPSVAPPGFFRAGPNVLGKKVGPYVPDTGWKTVEVLGTTPTTFVGRQLTVPAGKFDFSGFQFRNFPAFPVVANATRK